MWKLIGRTTMACRQISGGWEKFLFLACLAFSSSASAELRLEAGPTYLSDELSDGWSIVINDRITPKWDIGMGYVSEQRVLPSWEEDRGLPATDVGTNLFIHGQRIISYEKFELGIGVAFFQNTNRALGKDFVSSVSLGWNFSDSLSIRVRHFSNAGSGTPNLGQDLVTFGFSF